MCIIAYYKKGQTPERETVSRMMTTNPHGVGIGWNTGKRAYFQKGFVSVDGVMRYMEALRKDNHVNDIILHARIATSGGISAEKCHPFPVSMDEETLNKRQFATGGALVFHNGVLSVKVADGLNDTQTFIKNSIAPLDRLDGKGLKNGKYDELLTLATSGSRLLLLYPDGVRLFGRWETDEKTGVLYSNTGYKPYATYYGRWTDDDWERWESYYKRKDTTQTGGKYNAKWWENHGKKGGADNGKCNEKKDN